MHEPATAFLDAVEQDPALFEPHGFRARSRILEQLDPWHWAASEPADRERARYLHRRLEAVDATWFAQLRERVRQGDGAAALLAARTVGDVAEGDGYDHLDELVAGLLALRDPGAVAPLPPDMVFYQPTPARHIFDLIDRVRPGADDVLVDLGSGLGHVPLLVSICTPARCVGIELEAAHVESARRCAAGLDLRRVRFLQQDAREADLSEGTVFYLYTPFRGAVMATVLAALRDEARRRPLRLCSFGPCAAVLAAEDWLQPEGMVSAGRIGVFRSALG